MRYIRKADELSRVADALAGAPLVAADTEAAGYHRYDDRICLLQLTADSETYVVDTLAVPVLEPLRPVFAGPDAEVVFHDADYDLRLLRRDHDIPVRGLFDTKVAAQFVGERAIGLQNLLESHLGVKLEKKYQRADWAQRPLPRDMLLYAAEDTRHLPALRDRLRQELADLGRLGWAAEEFRLVEGTRWEEEPAEAEAFLSTKGARDLDPRQLAALRELHAWREAEGKRRDAATFRVLSRETMVEVARRLPRDPRELGDIPGVTARVLGSVGAELLAAVQRARDLRSDALPEPPRRERRPRPDPDFEERVDRLKSARDAAADRLELDRGFLMARWQLVEVAQTEPRSEEELAAIPSVRRWQVEALGEDLLGALRGGGRSR